MTAEERELLSVCAGIGTSTWSDALDVFGIDGVLRGIVRRSGAGRFAGYAATARQVCGALGDFDRADFAVGDLVAATGPGRVLMVDLGGAEISTFGGLASTAAKARGATAVVIDGACRDVDEINAVGLWLASRSVTPVTGKTRLKLMPPGGAVRVGGVSVSEGDLVVGDDTGIVVVARERIQDVLLEARRIVEIDHAVERGIRQGASFAEAAAAANYIPRKS